MIEIKSKPCPFCGSENVRFDGDKHAVVCMRCKARGCIAPNEDMARDMWNDRLPELNPAQRMVHVGCVDVFPGVEASKEQALKVLEEAAEVFGAWQAVDAAREHGESVILRDFRHDMLDEIADVIQAACNLAAAMGATDFAPRMEACRVRNEERGRYGSTEEF